MKSAETEGDGVTRDLITLLNTQYLTPFDRDDIYMLSTTLDDVVDFTPEINAISTIIILVSMGALLLTARFYRFGGEK